MGNINILEDPFSLISTKIKNIKLRKNQTIDNLLVAIGDDFGVTEEGILYARETYVHNGLFQNLACKNFVVNEDAVINGNLTVVKDLVVDKLCANILYVKDLYVGQLHLEGDIYVSSHSQVHFDDNGGSSYYFKDVRTGPSGSSEDDILNGSGGSSGGSDLPPDDILYGN